MSLRISEAGAALALLALAGCGPSATTNAQQAKAEQDAEKHADAEGRIPCALGGSDRFDLRCSIDRVNSQDGLVLVVRHPDGGFHRLRVTRDGRGVVAADGASVASVTVIDKDAIEVAIDDARYRLPATVKGAK